MTSYLAPEEQNNKYRKKNNAVMVMTTQTLFRRRASWQIFSLILAYYPCKATSNSVTIILYKYFDYISYIILSYISPLDKQCTTEASANAPCCKLLYQILHCTVASYKISQIGC